MEDGRNLHHEESIVIVGGGIGGLACALALHRVGHKAVVLEQSDTLRAMGTTLTLWSNAFRVLDVLGIGDKFRTMYTNLLAYTAHNQHGQRLADLTIADCEGGPHEWRAVERKVLMETLAEQLPQGTIRFNSRVVGIKMSENASGPSVVELHDGSTYSAKVVVGYDGANSIIASWMGIEKAVAIGTIAIRGVAIFPDGHKLEDKAYFYVGNGTRSALLPSTSTKVYWFIVWNDWSEGWQDNKPEELRKEALQRTQGWHPNIHICVHNTPSENFVKNTIRHRLNKEGPDSQVMGGITLAGDASHPTTPWLGQGGCMAMEDAIVLARNLSGVLNLKSQLQQEAPAPASYNQYDSIHQALLDYQRERHDRTSSLSVQSYMAGSVFQSESFLYCFYRNWFLIPRSLNKATFMKRTLFDVGNLPVGTCTLPEDDVT